MTISALTAGIRGETSSQWATWCADHVPIETRER